MTSLAADQLQLDRLNFIFPLRLHKPAETKRPQAIPSAALYLEQE